MASVDVVRFSKQQEQLSLESLSEKLLHENKISEEEVLSVVEHLQQLTGQFRNNSKQSESLIEEIQNEEMEDLNQTSLLFDGSEKRINQFLEQNLAMASKLESLLPRIGKIFQLERFVKNFSNSIRMIGTMIAIRLAKVGVVDMDVMVDSMKELAAQADESSSVLLRIASDLSENIEESVNFMQKKSGAIQTELNQLEEQIKIPLSDFKNLILGTLKHCRVIKENSAKIAPEITEVISSLQYHDITRQQAEHVASSCDELKELLKDRDTATSNVLTSPEWLNKNLEIQNAQLENILSENRRMFLGCTGNLVNATTLAEQQSDSAAKIHKNENRNRHHIYKIKKELETLRGLFTELHSASREVVNSISSVSSQSETILQQISHLETIQESLQILTYNSIFQARKVGKAEKDLEVIASEISKLSMRLQKMFEEEIKDVRDFLSFLLQFRQEIEEALEAQQNESNQMSGKITESIKKLLDENEHVADSMKSTFNATRRLGNDIRFLLDSLHFHNRMIKIVQFGMDKIDKIKENLNQEIPSSIDPNTTLNFDDVFNRYTTEVERKIYRKCLNQEIESDIEENSSNDPNDLGDNIELF